MAPQQVVLKLTSYPNQNQMLIYWRKNEKDELLARKKAEKEALDRAKAEEEARESKRQSRKLNFLLTQTELYSHFIGKKIKTHEAENMDGDEAAGVAISSGGVVPKGAEHELGLGEDGEVLPDIDYDDGSWFSHNIPGQKWFSSRMRADHADNIQMTRRIFGDTQRRALKLLFKLLKTRLGRSMMLPLVLEVVLSSRRIQVGFSLCLKFPDSCLACLFMNR